MRWDPMNLLPLSFSPQGVRKGSIPANGQTGICAGQRYANESQQLSPVRGEFKMHCDI